MSDEWTGFSRWGGGAQRGAGRVRGVCAGPRPCAHLDGVRDPGGGPRDYRRDVVSAVPERGEAGDMEYGRAAAAARSGRTRWGTWDRPAARPARLGGGRAGRAVRAPLPVRRSVGDRV